MNIKKYLYDNIVVLLFAAAALMVLAISIYTSMLIFSLSSYFRTSVEERLLFVSHTAAQLVTAEELAELSVPEDMEKPFFADLQNRLIEFAEEANVLYVYYIRPSGEESADEDMTQFIIDNDTSEESVNLSTPPIPTEEAPRLALSGTPATSGLGNYSVGYDGLLSAFSPVYDGDGNIVAIAGVDIVDEQILHTRNRIVVLSFILLFSALALVFCGITSFVINKRKQLAFIRQIDQQRLMSDLSRNYVSAGDCNKLITDTLRLTGEFMNVTRMLIGVPEEDSETSHAMYIWRCSDEIFTSPSKEGLNDLIKNTFPIEQPVVIPTIYCNDIHEDKRYKVMDIVGVKSFIWAPLYVGGKYWGVLSIEEFKSRVWTENDRQLVSTVSSVIAGALDREKKEKDRDAALRQAEMASQAKGDFLANMSHEMRTPMNAIIGMTSIAKNSNDIEKKEYCLKKIEDASTHLLGVINDILDMSKIEANKFDLSPADFNFERMLQKTVNVINFKVEERGQNFTVHIDKDIPGILYGDDQRLAQVVANLLSNAVKFTPENGSVRLEAVLEKKEDDNYTIRVSVADSGIGVSPEQQARLFSSFEQADTSTSRKFGGTGLGLAISKNIVEMMGGSIWVESELGKGSKFIFTVCLKAGQEKKEAAQRMQVSWKNIRVLAVDDDRDIRDYFTDIAGRLGFSCETAADGNEAISMIESKGAYDIYFVDWKMPGLDGIEVSRWINEKSGAKAVIIMISAAEWNIVEDEARKAGVDRFLSKPLFPSSIADCISLSLGTDSLVPVEEKEEIISDRFENKRILLAEDVEINREIVLTLLEPTGVTIDCAENGLEACKLFEKSPEAYDMIFMDVQMPEMDGYEATRRIRQFEASKKAQKGPDTHGEAPKGIPLIAMTANVFREDIEKCLAAGMDDHVGKPLDIDEVMKKMRIYLK